MMRSIVEDEKDRERSKSRGSADGKKNGLNKLDMAELREQHKRLTDKINESAKKMLEDGLRRNRKSSQYEKREEVRKSVTNLEFHQDGKVARHSSQNVG